MIKDLYTSEMSISAALCNQRTFISNYGYKIWHDENVRSFIRELPRRLQTLDDLPFQEKYLLQKESANVLAIISSLRDALNHYSGTSKKFAEELVKPRHLFPDSTGKQLVTLLGAIPLLTLATKKLYYADLRKKQVNEGGIEEMNEHRHSVLFERDSMFYRAEFCDDDVIDERQLQKKIGFELDHYDNSLKLSIDEQINTLCSVLNAEKSLIDAYLTIGIQYWDHQLAERIAENKRMGEAFKTIIEALAGAEPKDTAKTPTSESKQQEIIITG